VGVAPSYSLMNVLFCSAGEKAELTPVSFVVTTGQKGLRALAVQIEKSTPPAGAHGAACKAALDAELERLRAEIAANKKQNAETPDAHNYSEAETRDYFIDLLLKEAGWPLDKKEDREYPVTSMPNEKGEGFVDYVLWGDDGKPLGLVEAKRTKRDARVGQQQAKLYADCLERQFGHPNRIEFGWNGHAATMAGREHGLFVRGAVELWRAESMVCLSEGLWAPCRDSLLWQYSCLQTLLPSCLRESARVSQVSITAPGSGDSHAVGQFRKPDGSFSCQTQRNALANLPADLRESCGEQEAFLGGFAGWLNRLEGRSGH
jgi:hypothetical protein